MTNIKVKKTRLMFTIIISISLVFSTNPFSLVLCDSDCNNSKNILSYQCSDSSEATIFTAENERTTSVFSKMKNIDYVIITPEQFKNSFQQLINYKSHYLNATIISLNEILDNKSFWVNGTFGDATNSSNGNPWIKNDKQVQKHFTLFNDSSAKIRNFIRYAHLTWKTNYVLLGGDSELIPHRRFYGYIQNWSSGKVVKSIEANIVSDLYFGALNGTWNADFDNRFGEGPEFSIEDEADFSAEVYIGRAPVNDEHEVNVFVNKVISYETSEKPENVQLHQSYINPQHIPDTTVVTEMCRKWIPEGYDVYLLYEKEHMVTVDQWMDAFSTPDKLLLFQVGNGYNDGLYSWYQLSWDGKKRVKFNVLNAGGLSNSFFPIHISISCLTGDFSENECLAEELLLTRNGGPSACIANSEVGCISGNDASAYSAEFFEQIFKNIFQGTTKHLAEIMQLAKEQFSVLAQTTQQYRWCFYEINLLGDPETPVFEIRKDYSNTSEIVFVDDDFTPSEPGWNQNKFDCIQSAINSVREFGTINVNTGVYEEHLSINKTIILQGENKSTVIITNKPDCSSALVNLFCHSSIISNLTLRINSNSSTRAKALIHIHNECNGNTVQNNIIQGRVEYGILLSDSIRNTINNNWIKECDYGIGIITEIQGFFPSKIVITCDNIIDYNRIEYQNECGILIKGSIHNYIRNNTFLNNGKNETGIKDLFNLKHNHLRLIKTKLNEIHNNYWDKPRQNPYEIPSLTGPITLFILDMSRGIVFELYKCILIINMGYPSKVVDQNPSQTPYQP